MNKILLGGLAAIGLGIAPGFAAADTTDPYAAPEAAMVPESSETSAEPAAAPVTSDEWLDDRFYLSPFGTFMQPGGDRKAFAGWGGGLGIGKIINQYLNIELRGFWLGYGNNRPNIGGNTDLTGGTVDLQYHFMRSADNPFSPYAVLALGGLNYSYRTNFGTGGQGASFIWQLGLGATYELADNFLLRGDVRYQGQDTNCNGCTWNADVLNDLVVNAGFVIPLGEKPQAIAAAAPAPVDDCSTRDSDGDGVNDCDDKCPGTMKGAKVDEYGCLVRIELRGVNFHYDSAELTESAKAILDDVSAGLIASDEKKDIEVQGHTSTEGTDQYNMRLSQRRAASVVDYLKAKGVTNNLYPKGYGESYPKVSPDKTEAERAVNRRVELVWMGD